MLFPFICYWGGHYLNIILGPIKISSLCLSFCVAYIFSGRNIIFSFDLYLFKYHPLQYWFTWEKVRNDANRMPYGWYSCYVVFDHLVHSLSVLKVVYAITFYTLEIPQFSSHKIYMQFTHKKTNLEVYLRWAWVLSLRSTIYSITNIFFVL